MTPRCRIRRSSDPTGRRAFLKASKRHGDITAVSDAGLRHLKGLTRLKLLQLYDTGITGAGTAEIIKALPGVSFYP